MQEIWSYGNWEQNNNFDARIWRVSDFNGNGFIKQVNVRSGMTIHIMNHKYFKTHESKIKSDEQTLDFFYCLTGMEELKVDGAQNEILFRGGNAGIVAKNSNLKGISRICPKTPMYIVSLQITKDCFHEMKLDRFEVLSDFFCKLDKSNGYCSQTLRPTRHIKNIVEQILDCPYSSPASSLYFEGKSIELMAGMMDSISSKSNESKKEKYSFSPYEVEQLYCAKEILMKNLIDPPSLDELAKTTGMNHVKLNRGFKETFGTTVFGLLREIRLAKAKQAIISGEMNVTEASYSVGYSCISYFSKIFKNHYGHSPGCCLKKYTSMN